MGAEGRGGAGGGGGGACCAPLLILYYLCCWPSDTKSDTSSERNQSRRGTTQRESGSRRGSHLFGNRFATSAVSLHLPSTSGTKKESHRSHEAIPDRLEAGGRYHSAPSVIDEVLHRRDWDRSAKDLYIPLKPESVLDPDARSISLSTDSLNSAHLTPAPLLHAADNTITCKKHYTNIKSSKGRKERRDRDVKDCDVTEAETAFYIGDNDSPRRLTAQQCDSPRRSTLDSDSPRRQEALAKEAKQSVNESIRSREHPLGFQLDDVIEQLESMDRSGAHHHDLESRVSFYKPVYPPPSVEPAQYGGSPPSGEERRGGVVGGGRGLRARHASDGDILGPAHRPESGAFSESDVDFDLEAQEAPPPYHELVSPPASPPRPPPRKETAI